MVFLLLEEDERRNKMRLYRKGLRDAQNPFEVMSDRDFKKTFRYTKELAIFLIDQISMHLNRRRSSGIPAHLKVLATLHFLGTGLYQHSAGVASVTAMSQTSVSRAITKVCRTIANELMPHWIKFPTTVEAKTKIKQGFLHKFGFQGIIGCIDGTHVEIVAPNITDPDHPPHVYINRKRVHSINVMLICGSDCTILCCDARFPGSVHDASIWKTSDVRHHMKQEFENGDRNTRLIGDSGYGLEPWLFTPFARVEPNSREARFNKLHIATRNCIERTNGVLKGRFRCLSRHRVLHYTPENAAYIIYAAAVLHNIAIWAKLGIEEGDVQMEENVHEEVGPVLDNNLLEIGRNIRARYIRLYVH